MKIDNLPIDVHNRYAIDDTIKKHNPLVEVLRLANKQLSTLPPLSTKPHTYLSILSLSKDPSSTWPSFCPPRHEISLDYLFSPSYFFKLEEAAKKFFLWKETSHLLSGQAEHALHNLFITIKQLQSMVLLIQSLRLGIQQG